MKKIILITVSFIALLVTILFLSIQNSEIFMSEEEIRVDKIIDENREMLTEAFDSENFKNALPKIIEMAENNNIVSILTLSSLYFDNGNKVRRDKKKSFYWLKKASDMGVDIANIRLGLFYIMGFGVKRNITEAVRLIEKSIDKRIKYYGFAQSDCSVTYAQWKLYRIYNEGIKKENLKKDKDKSFKYLEKAARNGYLQAAYHLAYEYQYIKNYEKAYEWAHLISEYCEYSFFNGCPDTRAQQKRYEAYLNNDQIELAKARSKQLLIKNYSCNQTWEQHLY
jgi:TPR repeat protein